MNIMMTMSESEPFAVRLTLKWIGGLFFWLLNGFRGKYSDMITENTTAEI
jgi:hypothetical protein